MAKKEGAFTLIELLVAFTIILVATLLTIYTLFTCTLLTDSTRENNIASYKVETVFEEMMSTAYSKLDDEFPAGVPIDMGQLMGTQAGTDLLLKGEQLVVTYEDLDGSPLAVVGNNDPVKIICTITWIKGNDPSGTTVRTLTYNTVRTR